FSSRRRHTRLQGDWSSDVCSSDLAPLDVSVAADAPAVSRLAELQEPVAVDDAHPLDSALDAELLLPLASRKELLGFISLGPKKRSEERRVGKVRCHRDETKFAVYS